MAKIKSKEPFEHDGLSFSEGVHTVDADLAASIVAAGKAREFKPKKAEGDAGGQTARRPEGSD